MKEISRREALQQGLTGLVAVAASGTLLSRAAQAGYDPMDDHDGDDTGIKLVQCDGTVDPPDPVIPDPVAGNLIYCPSDEPEYAREYGALVRLPDTVLYEGADFDPFDGCVIQDAGGAPSSQYKMRVICDGSLDESPTVPVSSMVHRSHGSQSKTLIQGWPKGKLPRPCGPVASRVPNSTQVNLTVPSWNPPLVNTSKVKVFILKTQLVRRQLSANQRPKRRIKKGDVADVYKWPGARPDVTAYMPWKKLIREELMPNTIFGHAYKDDLSDIHHMGPREKWVDYVTRVMYHVRISGKSYYAIKHSPPQGSPRCIVEI